MDASNRATFEVILARRWEARFVSHLDTMRALSRALRRSALPIYFSEGFNPKPKLSYLTQPLSVGHTSQCERIRFQLVEKTGDDEAAAAMEKALPPGISLVKLTGLPPGAPKRPSIALEYVALNLDPDGNARPQPAHEPARPADTTPRIISIEEALEISMLEDPSHNRAFIEKYFISGALFTVGTGDNYVRPDEVAKYIPGFTDTDAPLCFHRIKEIAKDSKE